MSALHVERVHQVDSGGPSKRVHEMQDEAMNQVDGDANSIEVQTVQARIIPA